MVATVAQQVVLLIVLLLEQITYLWVLRIRVTYRLNLLNIDLPTTTQDSTNCDLQIARTLLFNIQHVNILKNGAQIRFH